MDLEGGFACDCAEGFAGVTCGVGAPFFCGDEASESVCGHGTCTEDADAAARAASDLPEGVAAAWLGALAPYRCACDPGWTSPPGRRECVLDVDEPFFAVMSRIDSSAAADLKLKPAGSFASHMARTAKRLGTHLGISLVCCATIILPVLGIIVVPLLTHITAGEILKQLQVKDVTTRKKIAAVGVAFAASLFSPVVRSSGPLVLVALKFVHMLGKSVAGSLIPWLDRG